MSDVAKVLISDRVLTVPVGDGTAQMAVPRSDWLWSLRYGRDTSKPPISDDRMMAATALESFRYLIMECPKEDAWARIKQMRAAILEHDKARC
jgi:hypothetical protein